MSFRARVSLLSVITLTLGSALVAGPVSAAEPVGWDPPTPIPGTAGLANPIASTAPDGAELVLWSASGSVSPQNTVRGKVRKAGSDRWVKVPSPMVDKPYGGTVAIAPTMEGDFWAAFVWYTGAGIPEVYVSRLDTSSRDWTKLKRVFHEDDYGHGSGSLGVSDKGVLYVAATATPHAYSNPPRYRIQVGVKQPGVPWRTKFLSPADDHAVKERLAVNAKGQAVVAFIQGYAVAEMKVRAGTRGSGAKSTWKVRDLSVAGDSQRTYAGIGADGTAAVEWHSPSNGNATIRVATHRIGSGDPWLFADAATGGGANNAAAPVVAPDGSVTALWETYNHPNSLLYARQLTDGVWDAPATPFSQAGLRGWLTSALLRPDGKVAALYQQFSGGTANEGLRLRLLDHGVPEPELVLTDAGDGSVNSGGMGLDAAMRHHLLWTSGDYPDTHFATMGDPLGRPTAMTSVRSGVEVTRAAVTGTMRVGRKVTCTTGYWVEAEAVGYRWFRGSTRIRGETGRKLLLVSADRSRKVSCRAKAVSDLGTHGLTSPKRRVR